MFAHHWYIASDDKVDNQIFKSKIDEHLKVLNDDYRVERGHALKDIFVDVYSHDFFMEFMKQKGKLGSQHKFPRVLKGKMLEDWQEYLKKHKH